MSETYRHIVIKKEGKVVESYIQRVESTHKDREEERKKQAETHK
ncbi:hypothetical protein [Aneurinibacillus sp. REN35]